MPCYRLGLTLMAWSICSLVHANTLFETLTGTDLNQTGLLRQHGVTLGGWVSMGGTYNTHNPSHHHNDPIAFNDRSGEFQLNQLNLYAQKAVDLESEKWNFGGKLEVLFGTDSRFTQATGLDDKLISENDLRFYDLAIPQAYLEIFAPMAKGVSVKVGHFYTILGQEVVTAPNNFFYSHAYVMRYGEPFTHTGVLLIYALNDNYTLNAGAVNGWDNFDRDPGNWNFLGGISWVNDSATTSMTWSLISGDVHGEANDHRSLSSLVISHSFTDKLRYVFQHDAGLQEPSNEMETVSYWYGVNQYFFYDLTEAFAIGLRAEWFRDNNGSRVFPGTPGDYFAVTAGVNWQPLAWMKFRPELRYDWVDARAAVFNNQTEKQQLSIAMDVILTF